MNHPHKKAAATLPLVRCAIYTRKSTEASKQPRPTDPLSVWNQSQRILFAVAHKVRQAIRLKLDGHGHAEVEAEELVHDAFLAVDGSAAAFPPGHGAVHDLRVWLGASPHVAGRPGRLLRSSARANAPHGHGQANATLPWQDERTLRVTPARQQDASDERTSVRRVAAIRQRLPRADRRLT